MTSVSDLHGIRFGTKHELETWRVETFFTKEPETIAWIEQMDATAGAFFDIGANIGMYSLYAASLHPRMQVMALEPVHDNYVALVNNIGLNDFPNIAAFPIAASNKNGPETIYQKDLRTGNSGAQLGRVVDETGETFEPLASQTILALTLDTLIVAAGFPLPAYIKIDVDGFEGLILEGMPELLNNPALKSLLIEFNSEEEQQEYSALLEKSGLVPDDHLNSLENHSSRRRQEKGAVARNVIYQRNQLT